MPWFLGQAVVGSNGQASVRIQHNTDSVFWQVEQITGTLGNQTSNPSLTILTNGNVTAPTSAMVPGPTGISQTASGDPYIYIRATDFIDIIATGAIPGDTLTVNAQYRFFLVSDPRIDGR